MREKKYYAVKKGLTPGVYETWEQCKAMVDGYSGAVYKSFPTMEEAERFVGQNFAEQGSVGQHISGKRPCPFTAEGEAVAYVDGSYNVETGEYSCGVVFFAGGEETHLCQKGEDREMASMRNVAGEIMGARLAMEEAVSRGMDRLVIYHDYQGIASWCLGQWRTNKDGTKAYKQYFDSIKNIIEIKFIKVKGHSGDTYNDLADSLARSALSPVHRNTSES